MTNPNCFTESGKSGEPANTWEFEPTTIAKQTSEAGKCAYACIGRNENCHWDRFNRPRAEQGAEGSQQFIGISLDTGDRRGEESSVNAYVCVRV
jgi:hypothetical protein